MKVTRSTTFQNELGHWEKVEIELGNDDFLLDEESAPQPIKVQLLENRIDKYIVLHMLRQGQLTKEDAAERVQSLDAFRVSLLSLKPKPVLKRREAQSE